MKSRVFLTSLFLLAISAAFAQVASHAPTALSHATAPADKPVARVNGVVLTDKDLVREEYAIFPYAGQHNGGLPQELAPQIRTGAMKMLIFEELVYQEAVRRNMTVSPVRMQRAESDFRKQFATPDQFNAFLQSDFHGSSQLLEEKIRRSLLIEALLKIEVESKCAVTPAQLHAYYLKNPDRFKHPESFTFQTISFLPPANATADQLREGRKRADQALPKARAAKDSEAFGMLAEKISDDDYRVMMGQHKPLPVDQIAPPVLKALRAMKPGDVSDVIQLDQAYTIVRLQVHTPEGIAKFEEVQASLQKELHETRRNQLRAALDGKLRGSARIDEF